MKFYSKQKVKRKPPVDEASMIRLQVDHKTVIVLRSKKSLDMWMQRYPNARIVNANAA